MKNINFLCSKKSSTKVINAILQYNDFDFGLSERDGLILDQCGGGRIRWDEMKIMFGFDLDDAKY